MLKQKTKRKPYRGAKAVDKTCRNHGSDAWARDDRLYKYKRWERKENEGD